MPFPLPPPPLQAQIPLQSLWGSLMPSGIVTVCTNCWHPDLPWNCKQSSLHFPGGFLLHSLRFVCSLSQTHFWHTLHTLYIQDFFKLECLCDNTCMVTYIFKKPYKMKLNRNKTKCTKTVWIYRHKDLSSFPQISS